MHSSLPCIQTDTPVGAVRSSNLQAAAQRGPRRQAAGRKVAGKRPPTAGFGGAVIKGGIQSLAGAKSAGSTGLPETA